MIPETLRRSGFDAKGAELAAELASTNDRREAEAAVVRHGCALLESATRRAQGVEADTDDRPLYWGRLALVEALRAWQPRFALAGVERVALVRTLEDVSRGLSSVTFSSAPPVKRILVSGFDPYRLTDAPGRGNPSGAAVLALRGTTLVAGERSGQLQGAIFPVRFEDFDGGIVERFFEPFLDGTQPVDLIMTISQGSSTEFQVEEFAARRRSETLADNAGELGGPGGATRVPPNVTDGPEFFRTALPSLTIRRALGRSEATREETSIQEIPAGQSKVVTSRTGPTPGSTAIAGSGGNYLSNEIFYRTSALRARHGSAVPLGHLHTPLLAAPRHEHDPTFAAERDAIVARITAILRATLAVL